MPLLYPKSLSPEIPFLFFSLVFFFASLFSPLLTFYPLKFILQLWFCSWSSSVCPAPGQAALSFLEDSDARPLGWLSEQPRPPQSQEECGHSCMKTSRNLILVIGPWTGTVMVRIWAGSETCRSRSKVRNLEVCQGLALQASTNPWRWNTPTQWWANGQECVSNKWAAKNV